jgi:AcrR family transcriptional regulator
MTTDSLPGRPRSPEIDARIKDVTRKLLAEDGYADLSMEAVARAADVGKQTLYRRWPRKPLLIFDAVLGGAEAVTGALPDTGSLATDLAEVTAEQARVHSDPDTGALLRGLLADCLTDPALMEELRSRFIQPRLRELTKLLERAAERGEIAPDLPPEFLANLIGGSMLAEAVVYGGDPATFGRRLAVLIARGAR